MMGALNNPPIALPVLRVGQLAAGNYFQVEADGTIVFVGASKVWLDELGSLIGSRLESPGSDIVQNTAEGSLTFKTSCRYPTDYLHLNLQFNHDRELGSSVEHHLHWWQTTAAVPNWLIGYRWQRNGQIKVTAWTNKAWVTNIFTWTAGTLNQITDFESITVPAGDGLSDILQIRLYRDVTNVSGLFAGVEVGTVDNDVVYADSHKLLDTGGSRQEYVK